MAISLVKGQAIDLRKNDRGETFDLSTVTIGLGWDVRKKGGLLGKWFGGKEEEYDLDAIAFLLDENDKVQSLGRSVQTRQGTTIQLYEGDIVFFNSMRHPSGHVWLTGDNRTGVGDGDDEQIIVNLDSLPLQYKKILFLVTIYQGRNKGQHFGMIENAFIRAVDNQGKEIASYGLSGGSTLNGKCSLLFSEVYRKDGSWKFRALGEPQDTDNFVELLKRYR